MITVKSFLFNPIQENTYVLYNEHGNAAIIDPGCYFDEEKQALQKFLSNKDLKPELLINTHCHLDHVFGNAFVAKEYSLPLHLHEGELRVLEFAPTSGLMYNLPFDNYNGEHKFLKEGDSIKLGEDELEVLFTPGHSPASISFYCRAQNFLISGDVLFHESIGRTDLPGGNFETLTKSIKQKLYTLSDDTVVYSGHGEPTTIGHEKLYNPFVTANS